MMTAMIDPTIINSMIFILKITVANTNSFDPFLEIFRVFEPLFSTFVRFLPPISHEFIIQKEDSTWKHVLFHRSLFFELGSTYS